MMWLQLTRLLLRVCAVVSLLNNFYQYSWLSPNPQLILWWCDIVFEQVNQVCVARKRYILDVFRPFLWLVWDNSESFETCVDLVQKKLTLCVGKWLAGQNLSTKNVRLYFWYGRDDIHLAISCLNCLM